MCAHWCTWSQRPSGKSDKRCRADGRQGVVKGHEKRGYQDRQRQHRSVAVAVDEAATQEIIRVDMMDAKRAKEAPPDHVHVIAAPCVCRPMDDARHQIRGQADSHDDDWRPPAQADRHPQAERVRNQERAGTDPADQPDGPRDAARLVGSLDGGDHGLLCARRALTELLLEEPQHVADHDHLSAAARSAVAFALDEHEP